MLYTQVVERAGVQGSLLFEYRGFNFQPSSHAALPYLVILIKLCDFLLKKLGMDWTFDLTLRNGRVTSQKTTTDVFGSDVSRLMQVSDEARCTTYLLVRLITRS